MQKPSYEEVFAYCELRHRSVDPVAFFLHYESNGWYVGKVPMKKWKAAVANWDRMQQTRNGGNGHAKQLPQTFAERDATSTAEAAARIRSRLAGDSANGREDRKTLFGDSDGTIDFRPRALPSAGD
jgi:hypothetical protein